MRPGLCARARKRIRPGSGLCAGARKGTRIGSGLYGLWARGRNPEKKLPATTKDCLQSHQQRESYLSHEHSLLPLALASALAAPSPALYPAPAPDLSLLPLAPICPRPSAGYRHPPATLSPQTGRSESRPVASISEQRKAFSIDDKQLRALLRRGAVKLGVVTDLIGHTWCERKDPPILELGMKLAF